MQRDHSINNNLFNGDTFEFQNGDNFRAGGGNMPPSLNQLFGGPQASIGKIFDNSLMGQKDQLLNDSLAMPNDFNNQSGSGADQGRQMAPVPYSNQDQIKVTIEQEGSDERFVFKNKKTQHDSMGNLLLAPLLEQIKEEGFSLKD